MLLSQTSQVIFEANARRKAIAFYGITSASIDKSWRNLTSTAQVTMPRSLKFKDSGIRDVIKRGDAITIKLGYFNDNKTEFKGYVTNVGAGYPTVIDCEDNMFCLKSVMVNKLFRNRTLAQIIQEFLPEAFTLDCIDADLGVYDARNMTLAQLLDDVKEKTGLYPYFKNDTLTVGKVYADDSKTIELNYGKPPYIVNMDLEYVNEGDRRVRVTAESVTGNKKETVTVGDTDGETIKISLRGVSKTELTKIAEEKLKNEKRTGWRGTITSFGMPYCEHGMKIKINDTEPDRSGLYYIDGVKVEFGETFRRIIEPGKKIE